MTAAQRTHPANDDLLARLPGLPDAYVQKVDLVRDAALVVQFTLPGYRSASFLDDRILTASTRGAWLPLARIADAARKVRNPRPLHFIFHTGHVGSTLVSRLLDETDAVLSLREPLPLRTLADAYDVLHQVDSVLSLTQFDTLCATLLRLWSRGYDETHSVVVKATSSAGRVAAALLERQESSRAIYMNLRAEPYLATLLAGQNSPIDLRGHGPVRIRGLKLRVAAELTPLHAMSLGELAAMSWLAESWVQRDVLTRFPHAVIAVDFDEFLAAVESHMQRILAHFGLPIDPRYLAGITASPVLTRYSKAAEFEYSPAYRIEVLNDSRRRNAQEIRRGMQWLERVARSEPVAAQILNGTGFGPAAAAS